MGHSIPAGRDTLDEIARAISTCRLCGLHKTRMNTVPGEGPRDARVIIVGEAPGRRNDETGRPFIGHGGRVLDRLLGRCGIARSQAYLTNVVKCWPPDNRRPRSEEVDACKHHLEAQIAALEPACIITLGLLAYETVTQERIALKQQHGQLTHRGNTAVCPTFHPNALRYIRGGTDVVVGDIIAALREVGIPAETPAPRLPLEDK